MYLIEFEEWLKPDGIVRYIEAMRVRDVQNRKDVKLVRIRPDVVRRLPFCQRGYFGKKGDLNTQLLAETIHGEHITFEDIVNGREGRLVWNNFCLHMQDMQRKSLFSMHQAEDGMWYIQMEPMHVNYGKYYPQ